MYQGHSKQSGSGKTLRRAFKNLEFTSEEWDELYQDFFKDEHKNVICAKFNLKHSYYKALKKYIKGS